MDKTISDRIQVINEVLQEKIIGKSTLQRQQMELETEKKELEENVMKELGINISKVPELIKELSIEIDKNVNKLETLLNIKKDKK